MTLVVLVPVELGYALYFREPCQRLVRCGEALHPAELRRWLQASHVPMTVVFAASCVPDIWLGTALESSSVVLVPGDWLRAVPRRSPSRRATVAARLARAHLDHPIQKLQTAADEFLELAY